MNNSSQATNEEIYQAVMLEVSTQKSKNKTVDTSVIKLYNQITRLAEIYSSSTQSNNLIAHPQE